MSAAHLHSSTIDPDEVAYFERLAHRWWDTEGPFWPLHALNALRVTWLRERLARALGRDPEAGQPFSGLRLLDIGCGGGILSESMAALGAEVTGIDITEKNVRVARMHAAARELAIDYRLADAETLAGEGRQFDIVLNMEVIEHVEHRAEFLADCARLVRPGGVMAVSSINRSPLAWLIAIIGAEVVLRWLPRGTHHYRKLTRPGEVVAELGAEFRLLDGTGVRVNPLNRHFSFTPWQGVNYMLLFGKGQGA